MDGSSTPRGYRSCVGVYHVARHAGYQQTLVMGYILVILLVLVLIRIYIVETRI